ncbi:hypothetical protein GLU26_01100 [Nanohaloarchaea archaeon]|nr:hypothetical protein [Candidatus Nanohaloarchaea archaeon]
MGVSTYGTEGEKQFKYTVMLEEDIHVNNFFGDLVDHWIRYESWNDSVDCVSAGESTLFEGDRQGKKIRLLQGEDYIQVEYGLNTDVDEEAYIEEVWQKEMRSILERNMEEELQDHKVSQKAFESILDMEESNL